LPVKALSPFTNNLWVFYVHVAFKLNMPFKLKRPYSVVPTLKIRLLLAADYIYKVLLLLTVKVLAFVYGSIVTSALVAPATCNPLDSNAVPLYTITQLSVKEVAPVPPYATGNVPNVNAPFALVA